MLFDSEPYEPSVDCCNSNESASPLRIQVAAEIWQQLNGILSIEQFSEAQDGKPANVRSAIFNGRRYTATSCLYAAAGRPYELTAWELAPPESFNGEKFYRLDYDNFELKHPGRRRGDMTGMLVKINGSLVCCAREVTFFRGLPTTKALALEEAVVDEAKNCVWGWRAMYFKGSNGPIWSTVGGHPVATYRNEETGKVLSVLKWNHQGTIEDYFIDLENADRHKVDVSIQTPQVRTNFRSRMSKPEEIQQACLF